AGKGWETAGNWPLTDEADHLVRELSGLRSRFVPEPLTEEMKQRFASPAISVTLTTSAGKHTLAFLDGPEGEGRRFDRPTFLRVEEKPEILRLAPGLVARYDRRRDFYMKRRLFPAVRAERKDRAPEIPGMPREEKGAELVERVDASLIEAKETKAAKENEGND